MQLTIPEAVLLIGAFFLFVTALILRGLLAGYNYSLGSMLVWLARHLTVRVPLPLHKSVTVRFGSPFGVLNEVIVETMQAGIRDTEKYLAYTWHAAEKLLRFITQAIDTLARETAATFEWLLHVRLRDILAAANPATLLPLLIHKLLPAILSHVKSGTVRIVHTVTHEVTHAVTRTVVKAGAIALPSPWAFPRFRRSWRELELWRKLTAARLKRLEALLAASGLALAVANMTGTTFRCWRPGGNIHRALRHLCGTPRWLLDLLVVGAVEAFVLTDLCLFSDLLMKQAESLRPALLELVDVEDALIGCHGTSKPRDFKLPPADLPPLQGLSPLAA